jgi:hypothetical protein
MTNPIDRLRRARGGDPPLGAPRRDSNAESLSARLGAEPRGEEVDAAVIVRSERVYNKPRAVSLAERFVETQAAALESIRTARLEQYRIAKEAEDLPQSARLTELNDQINTQADEIQRVKAAASVNGIGVLESTPVDLTINVPSRDLNVAAVLPGGSGVTRVINASVATTLNASNAVVRLNVGLTELSSFIAGNEGLSKKISSVVELEDAQTLAAKAEAQAAGGGNLISPAALASVYASELSDPFLTQRSNETIIDSSSNGIDSARTRPTSDEEREKKSLS